MKVWYLVANNGDGTSSVEFYQSKEKAEAVLADDTQTETYGCNEGVPGEFTINADGTTTLEFADEPIHA